MANQFHSIKVLIVLTQEFVKSRHLARTAGKKDRSVSLQNLLYLAVCHPHLTLDIFGASQWSQFRFRFSNLMGNTVAIRCIRCSGNCSTIFNGPFTQQCKHATRGALCPDFIFRPHGIAFRFDVVFRNERIFTHRAHLPALAAVNTQGFIYLRKEKSLSVRLHGNGILGAGVATGLAAGAFAMGDA